MATAAQLRHQIEATLAGKQHAHSAPIRLDFAPRLEAAGWDTGYRTLDQVLAAGIPVAGTTEIIGSRSSGRASLAAATLAERTREGHVCAWIDVAGDLSSDALLADGLDRDRVLLVCCSGVREAEEQGKTSVTPQAVTAALHLFSREQIATPSKPDLRPYNPTRNRQVGTPGAANRPLMHDGVQIATDRLPSRRGSLVLAPKPMVAARHQSMRATTTGSVKSAFVKARKPWSRLEQSIKAVDLLLQAGGFGAIVLDLGAIEPQFARRIPLATWFRWRSAAERNRCSLIVLSQFGCTGSSAELTMKVEAELPEPRTVLTGISYRLEVVRRRFEESSVRKPPARVQGSAILWQSRMVWSAG